MPHSVGAFHNPFTTAGFITDSLSRIPAASMLLPLHAFKQFTLKSTLNSLYTTYSMSSYFECLESSVYGTVAAAEGSPVSDSRRIGPELT